MTGCSFLPVSACPDDVSAVSHTLLDGSFSAEEAAAVLAGKPGWLPGAGDGPHNAETRVTIVASNCEVFVESSATCGHTNTDKTFHNSVPRSLSSRSHHSTQQIPNMIR